MLTSEQMAKIAEYMPEGDRRVVELTLGAVIYLTAKLADERDDADHARGIMRLAAAALLREGETVADRGRLFKEMIGAGQFVQEMAYRLAEDEQEIECADIEAAVADAARLMEALSPTE